MIDLERRWVSRALCAGMDTEIFFTETTAPGPRKPHSSTQRQWDKAKLICMECPVMRECQRDSIGEPDGVWGGLDPHERWMIRRAESAKVAAMGEARKKRLAERVASLRRVHGWAEIQRLTGLTHSTVIYLHGWYADNYGLSEVEDTVYLPGDIPPANLKISDEEKRRILNMSRHTDSTTASIAMAVGRSKPAVRKIVKEARDAARGELHGSTA